MSYLDQLNQVLEDSDREGFSPWPCGEDIADLMYLLSKTPYSFKVCHEAPLWRVVLSHQFDVAHATDNYLDVFPALVEAYWWSLTNTGE